MTVTDITKDLQARTITVTASFDAPVDAVWELYADPRKLERWWGPPSHPTTVTEHSLVPGGAVRYVMTGPEGEKYHGYWSVREVQQPQLLVVEDGFADAEGNPSTSLPSSLIRISLAEEAGRTTLTAVTTFASQEGLQQVLDMGVEDGTRQAMDQMDDVLIG